MSLVVIYYLIFIDYYCLYLSLLETGLRLGHVSARLRQRRIDLAEERVDVLAVLLFGTHHRGHRVHRLAAVGRRARGVRRRTVCGPKSGQRLGSIVLRIVRRLLFDGNH